MSLISISFMLGRKLVLIRNGQVKYTALNISETPLLKEWKHITVKKIKQHGYNGLVASIRLYVQSTKFLKNKYEEIKIKVKDIRGKGKRLSVEEKREVSGFLKMISEYKEKIREIKHKIKEEENIS